ncbi:MAG: type II toxin-antitoxin system RelE/ParE family toxin [Candidatus Melainabacteria bacterium]|nr:type II toxin-antitoxin system RelE/ParE family toxin [Candidatus Melainabacteria bacterium]
MRVLQTKSFYRNAAVQGLVDDDLIKAIREVASGLTGNALGSNLFKKRVAIGGKGKSGGLRTILVYKSSTAKVFCIHIFAKNEKANIAGKELDALKKLSKALLELTDKQLEEALKQKELKEIPYDGN